MLFNKSKKISQRDLRSQGSFKNKDKPEETNKLPPKNKWFTSANAKSEKQIIKEILSEERKERKDEEHVKEAVKENDKAVRDEEKQEVDEKGRNNEREEESNSEEETHSESTPRVSGVNDRDNWLNREGSSYFYPVKANRLYIKTLS